MSKRVEWQRIEQIYHDALEVSEDERARFLERACAGDELLRREVESLLVARAKGKDFLDPSAAVPISGQPIPQSFQVSIDFVDDPTIGAPRECASCGAHSSAGSEICQGCGESLMGLPVEHTIAGRYQLGRLIGQGGMGKVYQARDLRLGREVAIKILSDHLTRNRDALLRFKREARALAALHHPKILTIYEFNAEQDISYIVTELLTGETLRARIKRSALTPSEALKIALEIAEGLTAMHDKGITHRDIKPENIFLTSGSGIKILDFGVAHFVAPLHLDMANTTGVQTELGRVMGTVPYMSPEQFCGAKADSRSDIFSFGSVLYEMISGRTPFSRGSIPEIGAAILKEDPPKLVQVFPPELEQIVLRCLEKDQKDRYQSGHDLTAALKSLSGHAASTYSIIQGEQAGRGGQRWWTRLRLMALLLGGLALLAGSAVVIMQRDYLSQVIRRSAGREVEKKTEERRDYQEALKFYVEEGPPEGKDKTYKLHFIPYVSGSFYIIAPEENNVLKTFLTDKPGPYSGVTTNQCKAGREFIFPDGDGNWIQVTSDDPKTVFTVIFCPLSPTSPRQMSSGATSSVPEFQLPVPDLLRTLAGKTLTSDDQRKLEEWQRPYRADASKFVSQISGNRRLVAVPLPAGQDARMPVSFEIAIPGW